MTPTSKGAMTPTSKGAMTPTSSGNSRRTPGRTQLSRQRVLDAAMALADRIGIEAFTIRKLADELEVKPMTIYHHIDGKESIIDGIVDAVFAQIELPPPEQTWTEAMRVRCRSARQVLAEHPWAAPMMESRTSPGEATLRHHDAVLGCLRSGGLSLAQTAHAYALLDSFVYGFALQEASLPHGGEEQIGELAEEIMEPLPAGEYPHLLEFTNDYVLRPGYSFGDSFEVGLDILLEGLSHMSAG